MIRVKRGFAARRRRKRVLKMARGYFGARSKLFRIAKESVQRALSYAYRDRKTRKRFFRRIWIIRINAAVRKYNVSYSKFMGYLNRQDCHLNRKVLSSLMLSQPKITNFLIEYSKVNE